MYFDFRPDLRRLRLAWEQTVQDHSILRTSFHFDLGTATWWQAVHDKRASAWIEVPYCETLGQSVSSFISSVHFASEADFYEPPFRLGIVQGTDGDIAQVLVLHHALYDGTSISTLFEWVESCYVGSFREQPLQFADIVPQILCSQQADTSFWAAKLADFNPHSFPRRLDTPSQSATRPIQVEFDTLERTYRSQGVTLQSYGQACTWKLLYERFGSPDITFGHVVNSRTALGIEGVVGPMLVRRIAGHPTCQQNVLMILPEH